MATIMQKDVLIELVANTQAIISKRTPPTSQEMTISVFSLI